MCTLAGVSGRKVEKAVTLGGKSQNSDFAAHSGHVKLGRILRKSVEVSAALLPRQKHRVIRDCIKVEWCSKFYIKQRVLNRLTSSKPI